MMGECEESSVDQRMTGRRRRGAGMVEYGILLGLVSAVGVISVSATGVKVSEIFGGSANSLSLAMNGMMPSGGLSLSGGVIGAPEPPILTNAGSLGTTRPGTASATVLATLTATDPQGAAVTWSGSGLPSWLSLSSGGILSVAAGETPPSVAADQTFSFSATASDSWNGTTGSYSLTVTNGAPSFGQASGSTVASVRPLQANGTIATLTSSDPNGDVVGWSASGLPAWASLSSGGVLSIVSAPPSAATTQSFPFSATLSDGKGGTASRSFSISETNSAPTISTSGSATISIGSAPASMSGADAEGDSLTWSIVSGSAPTGLALNADGTWSGTSTTTGSFSATVSASDSRGGSASSSMTFVVSDPCPGYKVAGQNKCVFAYLGSNQSFVVPSGTTSVSVKLWGAGGGASSRSTFPWGGGSGGYASATVAVSSSETLSVIVGQGGGNGSMTPTYGGGGSPDIYTSGGQGGGRSAVRRGSTELVTAGGGGGSGRDISDGNGGGGGGLTGLAGGGPYAGGGGTAVSGGAGGGSGQSYPGGSGSQYQGGSAYSSFGGGGGGGGGYYGGGASGADGGNVSGGGGGGSGYAGGVGVSNGVLVAGFNGAGASASAPPGAGSADHVGIVGYGGRYVNGSAVSGGNGLVVISW